MMPQSIPTEAEVLQYFTTLSNWGRWGADDQLGTLNLITPELVSTGVVKQLGACRGVGPRKTLTIANLTANDENYALAA
jgi:hypothetical protein